jgi:2-polyprenyl-3-methyl-5-hydroxy-6-metoxy-1,4-benzoquinol methylase
LKIKSHYGKKNINKIKQEFIDESKSLILKDVERFREVGKIGFKGLCNVCSSTLDNPIFTKHCIDYYKCSKCGMLGAGQVKSYSDYNKLLYEDIEYGNYLGLAEQRLNDIYIPKADFLIKTLPDVCSRGVIDIGAGLGYFVKALNLKGVNAKGYEINKNFVENFNNTAKKEATNGKMVHIEHDKLINSLKNEDNSKVISLIGVLEHVENPVNLLLDIKKLGFKNLFISVPLFSFSTLFEAIYDDYYHRQLSPDHIYLYTEKALLWLESELGLKRLSQWYFGQDMHDILRILSSKSLSFDIDNMEEMFDDMQLVIDKNKMSSEVHLVWSF